jgi:DNA-binding transcriptional LysR family regulator
LAVATTTIERLLAAFRDAHPDVQVRVTSQGDAETPEALRERRVDVGCVFLAEWPVEGFGGHRLIDCPATGVLLPASHPLAAKPSVRLEELEALAWLHSASQRWPGFIRIFEAALRDRGLVPRRRLERPKEAPSANMLIAAGEAWTLAGEVVAAAYRAGSTGIVYRPLAHPPIPCWLALVWLPPASEAVQGLVDVARRQGLAVGDDKPPARVA